MGSMSVWHWIIFLLLWVAVAVPLAKLAKRTGHSVWLAWVLSFPMFAIGGMAYLWFLAFKKWPTDR
jgi:hypothetical protein